jgi:hypothetical protein
LQAIIGGDGFRPRGKAEGVQRLVEQDAGVIAGERAPGAIGAMHAGCQADDQQARLGVAKRKHGAGMVVGMPGTHLGKEAREAGTIGTT